MEIRELAERVLFARDLEGKLTAAGALTDGRPGAPIPVPRFPHRPPGLAPPAGRVRVPFPDVHALDDARARGQALHFFANHELLALELMALALLRFPDAPPAFRRGIAQTLAEEQRHLRLYMERMAVAGVELGEIPVNTFFWDCLADMHDPTDYVVGMCLTLEQANLDYALYYRAAFAQVGDVETARVLDEVFRDEVGHVKFGAVWFDRWRAPGEPAWEAYRRRVRFPLTPSRAKGLGFSADARRAAGLDEHFIESLSVFSQSKGRSPSAWHLNADAEAHVAYAPAPYNPSRAVEALTRDLESLPMFLCAPDDVVLVRRRPSVAFLRDLAALGVPAPEWVEHTGTLVGHPLAERNLSAARPWAASPDAARFLGPLGLELPAPDREVFSKAFGAEQLRALLAEPDPQPGWRCADPEVAGVVCSTPAEAWAHADRLRTRGHAAAIAKAPFGSAGRGMLRLDLEHAGVAGWLARTIEREGAVVVEPWLDKVLDLSVLFSVEGPQSVRIHGTTRFLTDGRGRYRGTVLGGLGTGLDRDLQRWLMAPRRRVLDALEAAAARVGRALWARGHRGPAGIDALVYRDREGALRFRPIVEINPRCTMGHVALALTRRVAPGSAGLWLQVSLAETQRAGFATFADLADHFADTAPPVIRTSPGAQLAEGVCFTTDPSQAEVVVTLLVTGRDLEDCRARLGPLAP